MGYILNQNILSKFKYQKFTITITITIKSSLLAIILIHGYIT